MDEHIEEEYCKECEEYCTYYHYVYVRGMHKDNYLDERCDRLKELDNDTSSN